MKRKTILILIAGLTGLGTAFALEQAQVVPAEVSQARAIVKQFGGALKSALKEALKKGTLEALSVCNKKAPDITYEMEQKTGWHVARTALKLRSQDNVPDKWETKVMEQFEARKKAGEDPGKLEYYEIVTDQEGNRVFRYMKAIPTQKVCLKCHGPAIDKHVVKQLDILYPFDQARGFHVGDIRGAFTLSKRLDR